MKTVKDVTVVEDKGCITFSRVCVNLGKVADLETGFEEYYCTHDFPEDCSKFGCPKYVPITNHKQWKLTRLSKRKLKMLKEHGTPL